MINWWGLFHNSLWIVGLAGALAALSVASYQARVQQIRLRQKLNEPGFQVPFNACLSLFCLGLLFSGQSWWEKAIWALLAVLFAGQAIWLWRKQRPQPKPPTAAVRPRARSVKWLGWGLMLAGLLLLIAWTIVTGLQVLGHARSLQSHLYHLEQMTQGNASQLELTDLKTAGQHLSGMRQDLQAIDFKVGPLLPAGRLLSWVPKYGGDLAAASDL
ncbi:MAG: hypothetical protein PVH17_02920, partial [Anaerolineae bacterium]